MIGPGYGESIVIHVGDGEWIIVDSCVRRSEQEFPQSAATSYLREIGVDPATSVSRVIATHWHDDHIGGLSNVVHECEKAEFCCAVALRYDEFLGFASVYAEADPSPIARSTSEIIEILDLLEKRDRQPRYLVPDTLLLKTNNDISVFALSPSNERVTEFLSALAANMPELRATRRRVSDPKPNAVAVALFVDLGNDGILLGADLEETPGNGWSAIVASSQSISERQSSVYKVAHHGSITAEFNDIWDTLLVDAPFAILTPFNRGRKPLPTEEDVERILGRTSNAYSAARLTATAPPRHDRAVERTIRESGWIIRSAEPKLGHVRLRRNLHEASSNWSVELLGNATKLENIRK